MTLSIVTINYNNALGLTKTLKSLASQTCRDFEHIIVDGASTDNTIPIIEEYVDECQRSMVNCQQIKWVSEPDTGIYNAMNKGIRMAIGKYIQILNSGDCLVSEDVVEKMYVALDNNNCPDILYGNMIKIDADGKIVGKSGYTEYSLRQFYSSTLNHDCAYIKRTLFERYGLYDENLKIVSDWKWYLQAIGLGYVKPVYVDIDATLFDIGGISEQNLTLRNAERRKVLEEVIPPAILWDYDCHAFDMAQMDRFRKRKLYKMVYIVERILFKLEKWHILK